MIEITYYNINSGEIEHSKISNYPGAAPEVIEGLGYVEGIWDPSKYYINESLPIERPNIDPSISKTEVLADGIDEVVITNLPVPATINVKGQIADVDDGELVLTFETPGKYRLTVEAFPHKPWEVTIHAT